MNYFIVNKETLLIENNIVWDGVSEYTPPEGTILYPANTQGIGDIYTQE